jgi:glycine/D-amino acid oxidase-like deaminating enzyme
MTGKGKRIVVAGAGIVGASIAWHLTRRGAEVSVLDEAEPGGVATPCSFSWINSNYSFARPYFELRRRSMAEWKRLAQELPHLPVMLTGSIYLPEADTPLEEFVAQHRAWGYRIELIDGARVKELEPNLTIETDIAALALDEGATEAEITARLLIEAACEAGASFRQGVRVEGPALSDGGVSGVRTSDGVIACDEFVIAAGTGTPALLAATGYELPFQTPPGLLAHTKPMEPLIDRIVLSEGLHIRQKNDGAFLLGADFQGGALEDGAEKGGAELVRRLNERIRSDKPFELEHTSVGHRPTPGDGLPVVGRVPGVDGLYTAVMHSGVTLAPAIGLFTASEIVDGVRDPLLAPFGPERFAQASAAAK